MRERQCSGTLLLLFAVFGAWLSISSTAVGQTPRKRLFGHGQAPVLTYAPQPVLPCLARAARIEGDVRLAVVVGTDGAVKEIRLISGHLFLVSSAMESVKHWRYRPAEVAGQLVESIEMATVQFRLGEVRQVPLVAIP